MTSKTALITGATGLVGKELVRHLLTSTHYEKIYVLSRRELAIKDNRLEVVILNDFDKMSDRKEAFNVNDIYCCLGTTMKRAGSKEAFKKIDLEYPLEMAKIAMEQPNFEQFLVVTAAGSNSDSPLFYNEVKGTLEDELTKLKLPALKIFRPSLLLGHREDFRLAEEIAKILTTVLSFFMIRSKRKLWSIKGIDVAKAMFQVARWEEKGTRTYSPREMHKIVDDFDSSSAEDL